jgi:hypothetical protein
MLLASKTHTVGNDSRWYINYRPFLGPGRKLLTVALSVASDTTPAATADTATILEGERVSFYTHDGTLNEVFTVTVTVTTDDTQTVIDTVKFTVVAP